MENQILRTFCVALFGLPLICESRQYCYVSQYYGYYVCEYRRSIPEIFGIAYGVVIGVGLVVSFFVFLFCRSRQNRTYNSTTYRPLTNAGYVPAGHQLVAPSQPGILQTTPPQGTLVTNARPIPPQSTVITNSGLPTGNQPLQTQMQGQAQAGHFAYGAGATAQTSQPVTQLEQMAKQNHPPPYSQPI